MNRRPLAVIVLVVALLALPSSSPAAAASSSCTAPGRDVAGLLLPAIQALRAEAPRDVAAELGSAIRDTRRSDLVTVVAEVHGTPGGASLVINLSLGWETELLIPAAGELVIGYSSSATGTVMTAAVDPAKLGTMFDGNWESCPVLTEAQLVGLDALVGVNADGGAVCGVRFQLSGSLGSGWTMSGNDPATGVADMSHAGTSPSGLLLDGSGTARGDAVNKFFDVFTELSVRGRVMVGDSTGTISFPGLDVEGAATEGEGRAQLRRIGFDQKGPYGDGVVEFCYQKVIWT